MWPWVKELEGGEFLLFFAVTGLGLQDDSYFKVWYNGVIIIMKGITL
jgi:hypothetical protein